MPPLFTSPDTSLKAFLVPGSSIYATPSSILRSAGSVGVALIMWLVGSLIAACGTAVYVELGTVRYHLCYSRLFSLLYLCRPRGSLEVEERRII